MRAPLGTGRLADERLAGQRCGRIAAERHSRGHEGEREALRRPAHGRLREDEADPRSIGGHRRGGATQRRGGQGIDERRGRLREAAVRMAAPEDDVDRAVGQQRRVVTQAGRDRPAGGRFQALDEATHDPAAILEGQPRVALPPLAVARRPHVAAHDAQGRDAAGIAVESARRQQRVEEGQPQRRLDGRRPQVLLDAGQDAFDGRQRARRPEVEDLIGQALVAGHDRDALADGRARRPVRGQRARPIGVGGIGRHGARFGASHLVPAGGTAIDLAEGRVGVAVPHELVDDDRSATGRAGRDEELVERLAQADLATRLGAERVDGGVEVTQVRRTEDDLGHQAREGGRLVDVGAPEAGDGGPSDPAAAPVQVDDDVAGRRAGLDLGHHQVERGRGREAIEGGQARAVIRSDERREGFRHRRSVYRRCAAGRPALTAGLMARRAPRAPRRRLRRR